MGKGFKEINNLRTTTAKEGMFNILENLIDIKNILELFCGSGNMNLSIGELNIFYV